MTVTLQRLTNEKQSFDNADQTIAFLQGNIIDSYNGFSKGQPITIIRRTDDKGYTNVPADSFAYDCGVIAGYSQWNQCYLVQQMTYSGQIVVVAVRPVDIAHR